MKLPIMGAAKPVAPPTHTPLDPTKLMRVASDLEDRADEQNIDSVTLGFVEEFSEETGTPESHIVASFLASNIELARESDITFVVCSGKCQSWGALDHIQHLLDVRRKRGDKAFDVRARGCLDRCEQAVVVSVETPDGAAVIPHATTEKLDEAIAQLIDG